MIYAWMAGLLIVDIFGFGTLFLIVTDLVNKIEEYHEETMKKIEEVKPKSPFGRYDL